MTLPRISGRDAVRPFERFGWQVARAGNHIVLRHDDRSERLSVPDHPELKRGTLRALIRKAGVSVDAFNRSHRRKEA